MLPYSPDPTYSARNYFTPGRKPVLMQVKYSGLCEVCVTHKGCAVEGGATGLFEGPQPFLLTLKCLRHHFNPKEGLGKKRNRKRPQRKGLIVPKKQAL